MADNPFRSITGSASGTLSRKPRKRRRGGGSAGGGGSGGAFKDMPFRNSMYSPANPAAGFAGPKRDYGAKKDWLDTGEGSAAFNDPEFRNQAVWSMLNQAGISNAGPGAGLQGAWLEGQVDQLIREYEGLTMNKNPDLTLENFMYGLPGKKNVKVPKRGRLERWRRKKFYPSLNRMFVRRWAHTTPGDRGVDTTRYSGPVSTVAF